MASILFVAAMPVASAQSPKQGDARTNEQDGLRYLRIPPGMFTGGCSAGDKECFGETAGWDFSSLSNLRREPRRALVSSATSARQPLKAAAGHEPSQSQFSKNSAALRLGGEKLDSLVRRERTRWLRRCARQPPLDQDPRDH